MQFLIQKVYIEDDEEVTYNRIMSQYELTRFLNNFDYEGEGIEYLFMYDITEAGTVREVFYGGWMPNCRIELYYTDDKSLCYIGYGEDH